MEELKHIQDLVDSGKIDVDRLNKLAHAALSKVGTRRYASAWKKVTDFLIKKPRGKGGEGILRNPKVSLPLAGIGVAVTAGGASKAVGAAKFRSALSELKKDPEVKPQQAKAVSIANMVRRWAPSVAGDPDVLKGTVKNIMRFPDSYLSYDVAKKLTEVEKDYQATHGLLSLLQKRVL